MDFYLLELVSYIVMDLWEKSGEWSMNCTGNLVLPLDTYTTPLVSLYEYH